MRLMYAMYLDVLVYYHKFKTTQTKVNEKEMVKSEVDPRGSKSEGDNEPELQIIRKGTQGAGMKRLHTRRKFDFKQAKVAADDANRSVLSTLTNIIMFRGVY
ncbi:hypothetical protein Hanom_Chr16g01485551 [Helianthus anomalus]